MGLSVLALGGWPSAAGAPRSNAVPADAVVQQEAAALATSVDVDLGHLRFALPPGFDTADTREARAAAEAEAAAAARAAQAAQAAADAASAPTTTSTGAGSAPRSAPAPAAAPGPSGLPLGVDPGSSDQVVTVVAPSAGSTSATLTAWQRGAAGWSPVVGPVKAKIGSGGVGRASETTTRTPAGTFTLTEAFGRAGDPGTALPYRVVDGDDWWVSDVQSPRYNQYAECARGTCDFDESASENLADEPSYQYAVVIDYNRGGTPGAGSAFFLHVSNGAPTAGCVAVDAGSLVTLMQWLEPASRPLIAIGVG